jgi:phosphoribosylaminoimidazole-succinocarboxamide synthase
MANGFQGKDGQVMPIMPDEFVQEVSDRYIQLYELITGQTFVKSADEDVYGRVESNIRKYISDKKS